MFDPGLRIGQIIKNNDIVRIFKCGNMGGMRRSRATGTLVIVSDYTKGIYHDKWIGGVLHYTGMGKSGDQDINWAQNATLAACGTNDIDIHLFEVLDAGEYIYCGRIELVGEPYTDIQPGEDGMDRKVWMFPIRPVPDNDVKKPTMFVFKDMDDYKTRGKNVATIPDDFERISLAFIGVLPGSVFENSSFHIQLELGSTPTPYEPYQPGTTATLTLPETIYGGAVDAATGDGSKEWEFVEFDGTENWLLYNNSSDVVKTFYVDIGVESYANYINILCDRASFLFSTWNKDEPWTIGSSSLSNAIYISVPNDVASAVEEWKSYLAAQASAGTPVTVCYKLATPSAFTSDGYKTIQPLEGVNTIYSDTDSVTVSGRTSWINLMEGGN